MFSNFAWSEMLVIACVAIIVVGPKDLPGMLRQLGKAIGGMKRMAGDFQKQFNDAIKDAELDDLKDMTSTKGFGPLEDARKSMQDLQKSVESSVKTDPEVDIEPDELEAPAVKPASTAAKTETAKPGKTSTRKTAAKPAAAKSAAKSKTTGQGTAAKKAGTSTRKTAARKPASKAKTTS